MVDLLLKLKIKKVKIAKLKIASNESQSKLKLA